MIRVRIGNREGEITSVRVTGHGPLPAGNDLLCAAVSAVTQTGLRGLNHYGREHVRAETVKGFLTIRVDPRRMDDRGRAIFHVILTTLRLGLESIAAAHPREMVLESVDDPGVPDEA